MKTLGATIKRILRLNTGKVLSEIGSDSTYKLEREASGKFDHSEGVEGWRLKIVPKNKIKKMFKTLKEKTPGKRSSADGKMHLN